MSGRNPFEKLTRDFSPKRRARVAACKAELRESMLLHELREARALTQKAMGEDLKVRQPAVAKLERRADEIDAALGSLADSGHDWDEDPAAWVRLQRHGGDRRSE